MRSNVVVEMQPFIHCFFQQFSLLSQKSLTIVQEFILDGPVKALNVGISFGAFGVGVEMEQLLISLHCLGKETRKFAAIICLQGINWVQATIHNLLQKDLRLL